MFSSNVGNDFGTGFRCSLLSHRPRLLGLRLDAAVDVPLLGDRKQGVGRPVEHEAGGEEREVHAQHDRSNGITLACLGAGLSLICTNIATAIISDST